MNGLRCIDCREPTDPESPLTRFQITGFSRRRAKGGQNHVEFREETGELLCGSCASRRRYGGHIGQGTLL